MKTVDTLNLLKDLEDRVENSLTLAIRTFQNTDTSTLLCPSVSGGWSIVQCLDHLNSYGHFYLPQINKALNKGSDQNTSLTFKSSWLGNYFTKMMLPGSGKKYKAFKKHVPENNPDAHAVIAEFIHQQELLAAYLKTARYKNLDAGIPISISPFIKLKLGDVFQFMIAHNERHLEQAKRNLQ
ncbi:MAG: DinB family protein [Cytophaga sp.]|uniref:DinB family protein n=1 Tax=Cytophaga sp. TaxID=29535 RepID=UPI003F80A1E1